jgi:hypothetical protein
MTKSATTTLEQHPLALQLAPGTMPDDEFDAFCDDIKRRGQLHDIVLFEDKVLDGWHRYRGCQRNGMTPKFAQYEGQDAAGFVIAMNILRRKLGTTQRAVAAARLNLDHGIGQDEASKRVGVSKLHTNLVVQAFKSGNARIIKMLENPDLTRAQLHEALVDSDVIRGGGTPTPASVLSPQAATTGLEGYFQRTAGEGGDDDDILGDNTAEGGAEEVDLDDVLGDPPSAGGKVISMGNKSEGGMPTTGSRPSHPERRTRETAASMLADKFKALTEADQVSFIQLTWHIQRKLLKVAGVSAPTDDAKANAAQAQAAKHAQATAAEAIANARGGKATKGASKAAKGREPAEAAHASSRTRKPA